MSARFRHAPAVLVLRGRSKAGRQAPDGWSGNIALYQVVIGAAAGLLPAPRAARMSPTQALWTL